MKSSTSAVLKFGGICRRTSVTASKVKLTRSMSSSTYLESVKQKLSSLKTQFLFKKGEIDIIYSPSAFYDTLRKKISTARRKIFIASLYIGKSETDLIDCVRNALEKNSDLKVYFLIDGLRGTREAPLRCSTSLLTELLKDYESRVDIRLSRTPAIVGLKGLIAPKRINEGLGLQHMKIYGFDDEVLLSGANLSSDYFSNRQDRYYLFRSASFSDYYFKLHQTISKLSYKVKSANNAQKFHVSWPTSNNAIDPAENRKMFIKHASKVLNDFLNTSSFDNNHHPLHHQDFPTVVYPVSQFTPLFPRGHDNSTEKQSILKLISSMSISSSRWVFTAGYFNMLPEIKRSLILSSSKNGTVITASQFANGFFESKGISAHLPSAYLHLSKLFLEKVKMYGKESVITLKEWKKGIVNKPGGWSYHAKGIWISEQESDSFLPVATCIGSSNYTKRAYSLDLESNAIILTSDMELRGKMQKELDHIMKDTRSVNLEDFRNDTERHVSAGVKVATKILGTRL